MKTSVRKIFQSLYTENKELKRDFEKTYPNAIIVRNGKYEIIRYGENHQCVAIINLEGIRKIVG